VSHRHRVVGSPEPRSYYGRPVIKKPAWRSPDVPVYLFLGGLAGASSLVAAVADLEGYSHLARTSRLVAGAGVLGSIGALIHDLGRPERFLNMLRVFKPTSPLSMGSWTLATFGPLAGAAAVSEIAGRLSSAGRAAGLAAAALGPAMSTYTSVLLADTAVPAWHEAHRELPFVFGGSALAAAGGAALVLVPTSETKPAGRLALIGAALELGGMERAQRQLGFLADAYRIGRAGWLLRTATLLTGAGAVGVAVGARTSRIASVLAGAAMLSGSVALRFAIFEAGMASAEDPRDTVLLQRRRMATRTALRTNSHTATGATPSAATSATSSDGGPTRVD
jgi:formate-dependent nitrite reductase membrane component NrfD